MEKGELTPEELQAINFISEITEKGISGGPPGFQVHPEGIETDPTFPYIFRDWNPGRPKEAARSHRSDTEDSED